MNLSAWIDLLAVGVELPLMLPLTPEGWALPSQVSLCICAANIGPFLLLLIRWRQGKRFSEIPYIYIIISIGIISCCFIALFWQRTMFLFGAQRSVYLLAGVFTLSLLDCSSSLIYFDYMKRFDSRYLTAVFLGEGLTGLPPSLLALIQGVGSEPLCALNNSNDTVVQPKFTEPRFSVTVFLFLIAGIIGLSLVAFLLLRCTNIVALAHATDAVNVTPTETRGDELVPMVAIVQPSSAARPTTSMTRRAFLVLLALNTLNSMILYGFLPSLSTYSVLPYGQKAYYYSTLLCPIAYPLALLLSMFWKTLSIAAVIVGSLFGLVLCAFIVLIAWQSPCPWWADTTHGAVVIISAWLLSTLIIAYLRITIGNRIKTEWSDERGMFYFGVSVQLGLLLGTVPSYVLVNVFHMFVARVDCQQYCL